MKKCPLFDNCDYDYGKCPKRSSRDINCEIIPRKPRLKRIRGFCFFTKEKHGPLCFDTCSPEITDAIERACSKGVVIATLTLKQAYLGRKG